MIGGISIRMIGFAESEARDIRRCLTALYSVRVGEQPLDRDFGLDWSCLDQPVPIAKQQQNSYNAYGEQNGQ